MALLAHFIDSRTMGGLTTAESTSFAHGLIAAPDVVVIQENTTTNNTSNLKFGIKHDATNVSITNYGEGTAADMKVVSIVFHSICR